MATATSIEIKRAQEAERLANELAALNTRIALLPSLIESISQVATKDDLTRLEAKIDQALAEIVKPVTPRVGRPSSTGS
jgi:hypothetical protein